MSELPTGWVDCEMGDIATVVGGGTPDSQDSANFATTDGIAWLTPADLSNYRSRYVANGNRFLSKKGFENSSAKLMPKGSVLFSSRAPIGYVAIAANDISTNQGFKSFVCKDGISPEYIYYWLRFAKPLAEELASGTTFAEISGKNAAQIPLRVAPLNEQRRIVAKLEKLLSRVDAAQARLATIPRILNRFRESVLASAYSGKLTAAWREDNKSLEDVSELYRKKLHLRRTKFQIAIDNSDLESPPNSWRHVPIGDLSDFQQGMQLAKSTRLTQGGKNRLPILRILNYANGFTENVEYIEIDEDSLIADDLDVILARTGETRGKVLTGYRGVFHNNTFRLNYDKDLVARMYLIFWLGTHFVQSFIRQQSGRSAQPDLTHKAFGPCPFPLAPLAEQQEIVRRVEALFKTADALEARYRTAKAHVDKLTQSILAKAFRGELVPQDPNDEPASDLLERIRSRRGESAGRRAHAKAHKRMRHR